MAKIAVCITTHNRPEIFKETYKNTQKYLPENAVLIVVDDASDKPVKEADYRFEVNVGIASGKNMCLELAEKAGADHIFLLDDDCYPITKDWYIPYVESPEPHLMYIFKDFVARPLGDTKLLYETKELKAYTHPRGCMMYFHKICLKTIGGFDTRYRRWGGEHKDISNRIFNAGLTTFRYADVTNSNQLIYSADEHEAVAGTVPMADRRQYISETRYLLEASQTSKNYCEYKIKQLKPIDKNKTAIICAYFTGQIDPQRNTQWQADHRELLPLIKSVGNQKLVIINDCFSKANTKNLEYIKVQTSISPYYERWLQYYRYLRDHTELEYIFCVDATDVKMLNNPFNTQLSDKLYVGDEPAFVGSPWMLKHFRYMPTRNFIQRSRKLPLLNCGVVGGTRETILSFTHDMIAAYQDSQGRIDKMEMGIFNQLCYMKYRDRLEHGRHVTTEFKKYETKGKAWFAHK